MDEVLAKVFDLVALDFQARSDESVVDLPAFAHDDELGEALVLRKLAVDGVKQLQRRHQRRQVPGLRGVREIYKTILANN